MRTIEVEDDVYNHILRSTEVIGEPATSILRRLLGLSTCATPPASRNGAGAQADQELSSFLQSPRLQGARTATKRYLNILGFAWRQHGASFERILALPPGTSRVYFGRSKEEIEASGRSTHPQRIPGSPFWALTNTDTPQKRDTLRTTLATLGYDASVVNEAVQTLV